jgi:hypothetical protein
MAKMKMTASATNGNNGNSAANDIYDDVGGCEWIPWTHPVVQAMPDPNLAHFLWIFTQSMGCPIF